MRFGGLAFGLAVQCARLSRFFVCFQAGGLLSSGELCKFLACYGASPPGGCSLAAWSTSFLPLYYTHNTCVCILAICTHFACLVGSFCTLVLCACAWYNHSGPKGGENVALQYTGDILERLSRAGYTTYKIRKEKLFGERVVQQLRHGELVSWAVIEKICTLLDCQPGDLVEHVPDPPAGSDAPG